jgi:hypothetical protein
LKLFHSFFDDVDQIVKAFCHASERRVQKLEEELKVKQKQLKARKTYWLKRLSTTATAAVKHDGSVKAKKRRRKHYFY